MLSIKVKYRKRLHRNRLDSVFYPGKSKENRIAVLHEYNICEQTNKENMVKKNL